MSPRDNDNSPYWRRRRYVAFVEPVKQYMCRTSNNQKQKINLKLKIKNKSVITKSKPPTVTATDEEFRCRRVWYRYGCTRTPRYDKYYRIPLSYSI